MRLSPHFTLDELIKSQLAARCGLDNNPPEAATGNLSRLARKILEPVRAQFGCPFAPSSGYRSPELNARLGSKMTSQHIKGEAVDFEVPGIANLALAQWIASNLDFDQLILEFHDPRLPNSGWVHCSLTASASRGEVLSIMRDANGLATRAGLPDGKTEHT